MCEFQVRVQQAPKPITPSDLCRAWVEAQKHCYHQRAWKPGLGKCQARGRAELMAGGIPHLPSSASRGQRGTAHRLYRRINQAEDRLAWGRRVCSLWAAQWQLGSLEGQRAFPSTHGWRLPSTQLSSSPAAPPSLNPSTLKLKIRRDGNPPLSLTSTQSVLSVTNSVCTTPMCICGSLS